jgi:hypothetical protein
MLNLASRMPLRSTQTDLQLSTQSKPLRWSPYRLALLLVIMIPILSESAPSYRRADWPHWSDLNHNCLNTRHELLRDRSEQPAKLKPRDPCRVIKGQWTDPYSGKRWYKASDVDIDHLIPLKWAHEHGGYQWNKAQREAFANDPDNLLIVEDDLNQQKSASGPDQWLPPKNRCWYKQQWRRLLEHYQLDGSRLDLACTPIDLASELEANDRSPNLGNTANKPKVCLREKRYCRQMSSCEEAIFYLTHCNLKSLDGDGDGLPCESLCRSQL